MCRWFAYISTTECCLLDDVLVEPKHSLSKQVHEHYLPLLLSHDPKVHAEPTNEAEIAKRNRLFNVDGFGVAWYTSAQSLFSSPTTSTTSAPQGSSESLRHPILHPALYKTIQPPLNDSNFRSLALNTSSNCVLAHIRATSASAITPVNNHPFVFGRHTIMHNGYISDFPKIARQMHTLMAAEAFESIHGGTDSEAFAALYMTSLTAMSGSNGKGREKWEMNYTTQQMLSALQETINTVIELQHTTLSSAASPSSLNICVTDGVRLVALRFRNHPVEQPPSLYYSTSAGITMNRRYPDHPNGAEGPHGPARVSETKGGEKRMELGSRGEKAQGHNPSAHRIPEEHGKHVIVASEPSTYKVEEWTLIEKNHAVLVEGTEEPKVVGPITYPDLKR